MRTRQPGQGERPRMRRAISEAGCEKSIDASAGNFRRDRGLRFILRRFKCRAGGKLLKHRLNQWHTIACQAIVQLTGGFGFPDCKGGLTEDRSGIHSLGQPDD